MEEKRYDQLLEEFTCYMTGKKRRLTTERRKIFEHVCAFPAHFDIEKLHQSIQAERFHISKATLYNTLEVLVDAGIIVPHQITTRAVQYELKHRADMHQHLICIKCGEIREIHVPRVEAHVKKLKITKFTPEYYYMYIYGICSKCRFRMRLKK